MTGRGWGSVARRGAQNLQWSGGPRPTSRAERGPRRDGLGEDGTGPRRPEPPRRAPDERSAFEGSAAQEGRVTALPPRRSGGQRPSTARRGSDTGAGRSRPSTGTGGRARTTRSRPLPPDVVSELSARGGHRLQPYLERRMTDAVRAYDNDRYRDALQLLSSVERRAPDVPAVLELVGLSLYRLGRWRQAIRRLEAFGRMTDSVDQLPVVADCYRALGRLDQVEQVWQELRQASPGVEVLSEGRLVVAGARADGGDLQGAIAMLEPASAPVRHPRLHHLRQWYALADLYERAGDLPRARRQFAELLRYAPDAFDAPQRLAALG